MSGGIKHWVQGGCERPETEGVAADIAATAIDVTDVVVDVTDDVVHVVEINGS